MEPSWIRNCIWLTRGLGALYSGNAASAPSLIVSSIWTLPE